MDINLWISVLLAIPLAIVANLFTPKVREWIDARAERRKEKKRKQTEEQKQAAIGRINKECDEIERFVGNRTIYREYLLEVVIRATLYGAISALYAGAVSVIAWSVDLGGIAQKLLFSVAQFATLFGSLLVFQVSWKGLKVINRVHDFEIFKEKCERQIQNIKNS